MEFIIVLSCSFQGICEHVEDEGYGRSERGTEGDIANGISDWDQCWEGLNVSCIEVDWGDGCHNEFLKLS